MTAIVALKHEGKIYLMGDRCGSNGYSKLLTSNPKVFKVGDFHLGYTSSFYMGQILEHMWTPPARLEGITDTGYFYKQVIPSIKTCLVENHFGQHFDDKYKEPSLGSFIIIYKNRIFVHQDNGSVLEVEHAGVGCGGESVLTSILVALDFAVDKEHIIYFIAQIAFKRCAEFSCGVSPEFDFIEVPIG